MEISIWNACRCGKWKFFESFLNLSTSFGAKHESCQQVFNLIVWKLMIGVLTSINSFDEVCWICRKSMFEIFLGFVSHEINFKCDGIRPERNHENDYSNAECDKIAIKSHSIDVKQCSFTQSHEIRLRKNFSIFTINIRVISS